MRRVVGLHERRDNSDFLNRQSMPSFVLSSKIQFAGLFAAAASFTKEWLSRRLSFGEDQHSRAEEPSTASSDT